MERFYQIVRELKDAHGIYEARSIAKSKRQNELLDELLKNEFTVEEKLDRIIVILNLMRIGTHDE